MTNSDDPSYRSANCSEGLNFQKSREDILQVSNAWKDSEVCWDFVAAVKSLRCDASRNHEGREVLKSGYPKLAPYEFCKYSWRQWEDLHETRKLAILKKLRDIEEPRRARYSGGNFFNEKGKFLLDKLEVFSTDI